MKSGILRKFVIGCLWAVTLSGTPVWAQENPEDCIRCYCRAANSCAGSNCPASACGSATCPSVTFTAECGTTWSLHASLSCTVPKHCEACAACAYICDGNTVIATAFSECSDLDCVNDPPDPSFTLTLGHNYTFYVCLRPCGSCGDCDDCTARAYVYHGAAFPVACSGIICNP